jgi:esterase/lipase superfamily enzyme
MKRDFHRWYSPSLQRDMELLVFGHAGARLLVFPTSRGRYFEWEDRGMFRWDVLGEQIERGNLQVYCVDSVDGESWYAHHKPPGDRAWRQQQYDDYLLHEVLPLSRQLNGNPFMITTGASFGAYHAMNFGLKHPEVVGRIIGMSGIYDIGRWIHGHWDNNVYHNNPISFIPNEHDPARISALQRLDIIIATGQEDPLRYSSEHMSSALWKKGIGNALRLWYGWSHDWPYWEAMLRQYVGGHD